MSHKTLNLRLLTAAMLLVSMNSFAAGLKPAERMRLLTETKSRVETEMKKNASVRIELEKILASSHAGLREPLRAVTGKPEVQLKMLEKMIEAEGLSGKTKEIAELQIEALSNDQGDGAIANVFKQFTEKSAVEIETVLNASEISLVKEFLSEAQIEFSGLVGITQNQEAAYKAAANNKFKDRKAELEKLFEKLGLCKR